MNHTINIQYKKYLILIGDDKDDEFSRIVLEQLKMNKLIVIFWDETRKKYYLDKNKDFKGANICNSLVRCL